MAVGKGSMKRAAKAAGAKATEAKAPEETTAGTKTAEAKTPKEKPAGAKKASASEKEENKAPAKKAASAAKGSSAKTDVKAEAVAAAEVIAAPSEEVLQRIVYQKSNGMLEREPGSNEIFGLGDEMPVYYF